MAILLRNIRTGFFYVGYNRWRVYPEEAFDFQTLERASRWVDSIHLSEVEIVQVPATTQAHEENENYGSPDSIQLKISPWTVTGSKIAWDVAIRWSDQEVDVKDGIN